MDGHQNIVVCAVYMSTVAISTFFGWVYDAITIQSVDIYFSIALKGISIFSIAITIILNWKKLKANFKEKISKIKSKK